jgi:alanine racemase
MNNYRTVLEIDGSALEHNLNYFKQKLRPTTKILAVVKAFGYGSDGAKVASFLADKVDYFAVAFAEEGIALRNEGVKSPILVLHPQLATLEEIVSYCLEPSLYSLKILDAFLEVSGKNNLRNYPIHIKFNTGLNRLGFLPTDIPEILERIKESNKLKITSVFSHLAASEDENELDFTLNQINTFTQISEQFYKHLEEPPMMHLLNTSGVVNYPEAQFDMVRIGLGLYGFGNDKQETAQLKNTHHLTSVISQIHFIAPGQTVGYNRAFLAVNPTKTATIPIGHADGISRRLGKQNYEVIINKQKAPIIGNVCMDMIMVDVTKIACKEGDQVIIFNSQEMILEMAEKAGTISYEILTGISQRVKRFVRI